MGGSVETAAPGRQESSGRAMARISGGLTWPPSVVLEARAVVIGMMGDNKVLNLSKVWAVMMMVPKMQETSEVLWQPRQSVMYMPVLGG